MTFKAEYQYKHWTNHPDSEKWWISCSKVFKSKAARTRYINDMNKKYITTCHFRAKKDKNMKKEVIVVYTDGSCNYRDKLGGIGVYIKCGKHESIISKGYSDTTNNRMELRAVVEALRAIIDKSYTVNIYSDSELVVNTFTSWMFKWSQDGFVDHGQPDGMRKNKDIVTLGLEEYNKFPKGNVVMRWCKGHNGIEGNEIADMLATEGRKSGIHEDCRKEK